MYTRVIFALAVFVVYASCQGIPTKKCPKGEHSVLYCPQKAEPNCDNPTVHDMYPPGPCGVPQCFCNTPTVRDLGTGQCVEKHNCPGPHDD